MKSFFSRGAIATSFCLLTVLLLSTVCFNHSTLTLARAKQQPESGKEAKKRPADGMDVALLMKDSRGVFAPVDPSREFVSGEQFRVEYTSRLDGIVYFVNVDPLGGTTMIYRDEVLYGNKYVHPSPEEKTIIKVKGTPRDEVL